MFYEPKVRLDRFDEDIEAFEKEPVKKGMIMLYGDSGFTRWKEQYGNANAEDVLLGKDGKQAVVNHGFGGATSEEMLYYYDRAVKPWAPRALVVKARGNDAALGYTSLEVISLQARLLEFARTDLPGVKLYLCNTGQPISARQGNASYKRAVFEYNELCEDYCEKHCDVSLIDLWNVPEKYGDPSKVGDPEYLRDDLYAEDGVHFNAEGYKIYAKVFKEALSDIL